MTEIQKRLYAHQDAAYREFNSRLLPGVDPETVIGVRTPILRKLAKELVREGLAEQFLDELPHRYFEENNLHAFILESSKDFNQAIYRLEQFLPYVDNWSTCDQMNPKVLKKDLRRLLPKINGWIRSEQPFTVRYGLGMLMRYFLDDDFQPEYLESAASVHRSEYYVRMMAAWFFATALAKQEAAVLPYIENRRLDPWVHNKTIQKAVESDRIRPELKEYLKSLKVPSGIDQ